MGRVQCVGISGKCEGKQHLNLPIPCPRKALSFAAHSIRNEPAHCVFIPEQGDGGQEASDVSGASWDAEFFFPSKPLPLELFHLPFIESLC